MVTKKKKGDKIRKTSHIFECFEIVQQGKKKEFMGILAENEGG